MAKFNFINNAHDDARHNYNNDILRNAGIKRNLRIILPGILFLITCSIFYFAGDMDHTLPTPIEDISNIHVGVNTLLTPEFSAVDERGTPYKISAKSAEQTINDQNTIILSGPKAHYDIGASGRNFELTANQGYYKQDEQNLSLKGDVILAQPNGLTLLTEHADIDLQRQIANGNDPVKGQGPDIELEGAGFESLNKDKTIILKGPARVLLF